jgi:2-oxo-4-hydroxy-4-carboxy-5-ureidoimidazoline decarboxylase
MRLSRVNAASRAEFVDLLGAVFEHAPWVADAAYEARPFPDRAHLHAAMMAAVEASPAERQIAFLNGHPELGARAEIVADLTADSAAEQMSAGLTRLSAAEFDWFRARNRAYRDKFGFPFIIAVRRHTKQAILDTFERRLQGEPEEERAQALREIAVLTRLRLDTLIEDGD